MYAKGKGSNVPSDAQAREKLALYVYEYLLHVGAQKAAQTFLSEIRWEKNITLGEPPGFLHSWWCVFWDLYCAAPERRETCDHSSEAKAFHDYGFVNPGNYGVNGMAPNGGPAPSPLGQMPPGDMPQGTMPPGFFPNSTMRPSPQPHPASQSSPHASHGQAAGPHGPMISPQFMPARFPGGPRPGVRMSEFGGPPNQPMMPAGMEHVRPGADADFFGFQDLSVLSVAPTSGPPGMAPRMMGPRGPMGPGLGPIVPGGVQGFGPPGMRGPHPGPMGPGGPVPMSMAGSGVPRPHWPPNASAAGGGPGTPMHMSSPQDHGGGPDPMYGMMKPVSAAGMHGAEFPMTSMADGAPHAPVMNGAADLEPMKSSPANGPGTPRDDPNSGPNGAPGPGMPDYGMGGSAPPFAPTGDAGDTNESAAILKIKESMQEEAKRFEKEGDQSDYTFMQ